MKEALTISGDVVIEVLDKDLNVIDRVFARNFFTEDGEDHIADQLSDQGENQMAYMAIGDGTGQDRGDTTLSNELARVAFDSGYPTSGGSGDENDVIYKATFAAGTGTGTIREAAVFNAASSGDMLNYTDSFSETEKAADQSLVFTWTIHIGQK